MRACDLECHLVGGVRRIDLPDLLKRANTGEKWRKKRLSATETYS